VSFRQWLNTVAPDIKPLGIAYDWLVIAICAVGGIVGAILIIVLHSLGIAFLG